MLISIGLRLSRGSFEIVGKTTDELEGLCQQKEFRADMSLAICVERNLRRHVDTWQDSCICHTDAALKQLFEFRATPSDQSCFSSSSLSAACCELSTTFLPFNSSATCQHSSRLKQKIKAGVRRATTSPSTIFSTHSSSMKSSTHWKLSGTLRSVL